MKLSKKIEKITPQASNKEEEEPWAVTEFADAELNDIRRTQRLIEMATAFAEKPGASIPEACGSKAMTKAVYRFFDNEAIDPHDILQSHVGATSRRIEQVPVMLAVQDTTELNWTHHPET
jgi:hypothetical protein